MSNALLAIQDVSKAFGGLRALANVSFEVHGNEIISLIGPNGAGKSTMLNIINGFLKPTDGRIRVEDRETTRCPVHTIAGMGIARTFQKIRIFKNLTVLENVQFATISRCGFIDAILCNAKFRAAEEEAIAKARYLLEMVGLGGRLADRACDLPYGQQRLLEIARAMAGNVKLLLLDEPGAGMNDEEMKTLQRLLRRIRSEFRISILVVEHNVDFVLQISDRIVVFDHGVVIAQGAPKEVINNPQVIEAYLGRKHHG